MKRFCNLLQLLILVSSTAVAAWARVLSPETLAAFDRYVALTDTRIRTQVSDPSGFLYLNTLPAAGRGRAFASLRRGNLYVTPITARGGSSGPVAVPGGLIHHWLGAVFIPGVSMADVLKVVEDYDHKQDDYPEVVSSRLLSRDGDRFKAAMRLREHHVITVTLDADFDVTYSELDPKHWYATAVSTQIRQVENAGQRREHDLPDGQGDGFLWRLDTDWRYVEQDGGVYVEIEALSLTRDIPDGLGWLITPFVTRVPRESLTSTLEFTRAAVLKRKSRPAGEAREFRSRAPGSGR